MLAGESRRFRPRARNEKRMTLSALMLPILASMRVLSLLLCINLFLFSGIATSSAAEKMPPREMLLVFYTRDAFANASQKLNRFRSRERYKIDLVCFAPDCSQTLQNLSMLLPASRFQINITRTFQKDSYFTIILYEDSDKAAALIGHDGDIQLTSEDKVFQDGAYGCRSVSILVGNEVERLQLYVSNKVPQKEITACIIYQTMKGSGLSKKENFSEFWKSISKREEILYSKLMTYFARMILIHFAPGIDPGIDRPTFEKRVTQIDTHDLFGVR